MLGGLRSAFLSVDDVDAAKAWYTELLGDGPYFDEPLYVGFDCDLGWPQSGLDDPETDWLATSEYFDNAWTHVMSLFADYATEAS